MERIPIVKVGDYLLVTVQVDMHDRLALTLQDDLTERIVQHRTRGVLIDISALDILALCLVLVSVTLVLTEQNALDRKAGASTERP